MSEPTRIGLRVLGFVLLALGIAGILLLFVPGPTEIAEWMGDSCTDDPGLVKESEPCSAWDVIETLLVAPLLILVGGVMALALRPESKGPMTLDFSRRR